MLSYSRRRPMQALYAGMPALAGIMLVLTALLMWGGRFKWPEDTIPSLRLPTAHRTTVCSLGIGHFTTIYLNRYGYFYLQTTDSLLHMQLAKRLLTAGMLARNQKQSITDTDYLPLLNNNFRALAECLSIHSQLVEQRILPDLYQPFERDSYCKELKTNFLIRADQHVPAERMMQLFCLLKARGSSRLHLVVETE